MRFAYPESWVIPSGFFGTTSHIPHPHQNSKKYSKKYFENPELIVDECIQQHGIDYFNSNVKPIFDKDGISFYERRIDVSLVNNSELDTVNFKLKRPALKDLKILLEDGKYICGSAIEKMSKSYFNVVNPDQIINDYGADTLRLYEMFLGPLEQSKPWNTSGIDGVFKFLRQRFAVQPYHWILQRYMQVYKQISNHL